MSDTNRHDNGDRGGRASSRRRYLAVVSAATTATIAGCNTLSSSDGGDDDEDGTSTGVLTTVSGPAQFARYAIEGPDRVTVDEAATFTVSAVNVGGEPGDLATTLRVIEGAGRASADVTLEDVAPGARGEAAVEVTFARADEMVLAVGDREEPDVEYELVVEPVAAGVGEALELDRLRATLSTTRVRSSVYRYRDGERRGVYAPGDGQVLLVLRFAVENTGTEPAGFRLDRLELSDGTLLPRVDDAGLGALNGIAGRPIADARIDPAQERTGWLLAQVPREAATEGLEVRWQRDGPGTPPERVWTVPGADALPDLRLVEWTLPETPQQGTVPYEVTVENAGGAAGTLRGLVQRGRPAATADQLPVREAFAASVAPGERRTFTVETTWLFSTERAYRLQPFGERRVVAFQPARAAFGETVAMPQEVSMRIGNPRFAEAITVDPYGTDPRRYTSENGRFLIVDGFADAPDGPANGPAPSEFSARVEGAGTYDKFGPRGALIEPYTGKRPREQLDLRTHVNPDGVAFVLVFDVAASADASNVTVRWDDQFTEGRSSIRWRQP